MATKINNIDKDFEDANVHCVNINGAIKSPPDDRDWNWESRAASRSEGPQETPPKEYSLLAYCQPIRDQEQTSTCVAQSVACIREVQEYLETANSWSMSPLFIYSQRVNIPSDGMYGRDAMSILCKKGICLEQSMPFNQQNVDVYPTNFCFQEADDLKSKNYAKIISIIGAKRAIMQNGPLLILLPAYSSRSKFWLPLYKNQESEGGHAVTIIGWTTVGFILRNSWGKDWADHGYTILPFKEFKLAYECWSLVDDATIYVPLSLRQSSSAQHQNLTFCEKIKRLFNK